MRDKHYYFVFRIYTDKVVIKTDTLAEFIIIEEELKDFCMKKGWGKVISDPENYKVIVYF